jgi:hypothetical protein
MRRKWLAVGIILLFIGESAIPCISGNVVNVKILNNTNNKNNSNLQWAVFIGRIKDYKENETTYSFYIINCILFGWNSYGGFWIDHMYNYNYELLKEFVKRYGLVTNNLIFSFFIYTGP